MMSSVTLPSPPPPPKKKILYLPSAVFIAQRLVGPSKQLKQIIQIQHNIVKNPNWPEANQLAIYKRGRGFELGTIVKQLQLSGQSGTCTRDLRISSPAP